MTRSQANPVPKPAPKPPPPAVLMTETDHTHCRYPITDCYPWYVCGEHAVEGTPYCAAHRKLCYVQARPHTGLRSQPMLFGPPKVDT